MVIQLRTLTSSALTIFLAVSCVGSKTGPFNREIVDSAILYASPVFLCPSGHEKLETSGGAFTYLSVATFAPPAPISRMDRFMRV